VKDLGTTFEQQTPKDIQAIMPDRVDPGGDDPFATTLTYITQSSPSFSLRGGTREILRGIIARELGLR
jgi:hypothetical protein